MNLYYVRGMPPDTAIIIVRVFGVLPTAVCRWG
jgi:hypothetical protein